MNNKCHSLTSIGKKNISGLVGLPLKSINQSFTYLLSEIFTAMAFKNLSFFYTQPSKTFHLYDFRILNMLCYFYLFIHSFIFFLFKTFGYLVWFGLVWEHINLFRLFNARSIFMWIICSISNNLVFQTWVHRLSKAFLFQTIQFIQAVIYNNSVYCKYSFNVKNSSISNNSVYYKYAV